MRRDGTYVSPHYRTSPNGSRTDNRSTKGNVNPYTGEPGAKQEYVSPQSNPTRSVPSDAEYVSPNLTTSDTRPSQNIHWSNQNVSGVPQSSFGRSVFSRAMIGTGQLSILREQETEDGSKTQVLTSESQVPAFHWDIIGIRSRAGFGAVAFLDVMEYELRKQTRSFDVETSQLGGRIDFHPVRADFAESCRFGAYIGLGYAMIVQRRTDSQNSGYYTQLSGSGGVAAGGADLTFFERIGVSAAWNGFSGRLNSFQTSESAKKESKGLQKEARRNPAISGSSLTGGFHLNLDF